MKTTRVFVLAREPLFAQGVRSLISGQTGIEVVGAATVGPEALALMQAAAPDVVVIEARGEEQAALVAQVLEVLPQTKVVGLSPDDNRLHIYYAQMRQGRRVEDFLEAIRQPPEWPAGRLPALRVYLLFQGFYGSRIADNLRRHAPANWAIEAWRLPPDLAAVLEAEPGDPLRAAARFLPERAPAADLLIALGESASVAHLVPGLVERSGAKAVIAPVDNPAWLPEGVARLLRARLAELGVAVAFPRPFCSLTEHAGGLGEQQTAHDSPWFTAFARHFGQPALRVVCDGEDVLAAEVERDAPCGCARAFAERLAGSAVCDLLSQAETFHRQYPCLAASRIEPGLGMSLQQAACALLQRAAAVGAGVDVAGEGAHWPVVE